MKLFSVFSDHALYQADSVLTLRGIAAPGARINAVITPDAGEGSCTAGEDGRFYLNLSTPSASYQAYTITLTNGQESIICQDILFGELWIATGQSNMELPNSSQPQWKEMFNSLQGHPLRVFRQDYGDNQNFSRTPEEDTKGEWLTMEREEGLKQVSALATSVILEISKSFEKEGKEIPVGFLNTSWGGTFLETWLPYEEMEAYPGGKAFLKKYGFEVTDENWNQKGELNFQQASAQYNRKIAPVRGIKARGVLWYQGEGDVGHEWESRMYGQYLKLFHRIYKDLFAADPDRFPMFSSLLYPWVYGESGECKMSYVNYAFMNTAIEEPEKFVFCPIADLKPVWDTRHKNHPIHPTHKYQLGKRMSMLVLRNTYGVQGQKAPATLKTYQISGNRILLTFRNVGEGLHLVGGNRAAPLYIADENNLFLPAECDILSPDTLAVYNRYIDRPQKAAYAFSSFEIGSTLWAGDFPVGPFYTHYTDKELPCIEAKPFMELNQTTVWENRMDINGRLDVYNHSVWKALEGSELAYDEAFVQDVRGRTCSVRIESREKDMGAYVTGSPYNALDFNRYQGMELSVFCRGNVVGNLMLTYADGQKSVCAMPYVGEDACFFQRYKVDFSSAPQGIVVRADFLFHVEEEEGFHFVNIGDIGLVPKK